jgi:single-stranded-DNA-specific exonuclease
MTQGNLFSQEEPPISPLAESPESPEAAGPPEPEDAWRQLPSPPVGFGEKLGLPSLHALLLYNRGVRVPSDVASFLAVDERLVNDPWLMPHMDEAVELLQRVIADGGAVAVFGDFDVDGISGTAVLCRTVTELGGRPIPYIPNRMAEGHGLQPDAIEQLAAQGAKLLITVDTGTTAAPEVAFARSLGLEVIITDHHVASDDIPDGVPILNPGLIPDVGEPYPYTGLTGAGVAFKLAQAACERAGQPFPEHLLELAALGTVADVAPLTGENRFIVGRGLQLLRKSGNIGINAIASCGDIDLSSLVARDLSFGLIPRLNAAGRLDDPSISLRLLTTEDQGEAAELADRLEAMNNERRRITDKSVREAEEMVAEASLQEEAAIVVSSPDWHLGVIGLIAGRLAERHGKPAVAAKVADGNMRASSRGPEGINVVEAISATGLPFLRMGGHAQAAGFTLGEQHLADFKRLFPARVAEMGSGLAADDTIEYDCELELSAVNHPNFTFINSMAPFGRGNPAPKFMTRGVRVLDARTVGRGDGHLKLRLSGSGTDLEAIAFGLGPRLAELGSAIDLVYTIDINEWGGRRRLELKVVDFRSAS